MKTETRILCLSDKREHEDASEDEDVLLDKLDFAKRPSHVAVAIPSHELDQSRVYWSEFVDTKRSYLALAWSDEEWLSYRLMQANVMLRDSVEIDHNKRGGIPVIKGTRFTVSQVLAEIADGRSVPELCAAFELETEPVTVFIQTLSIYLDRPAPSATYAHLSARRMLE